MLSGRSKWTAPVAIAALVGACSLGYFLGRRAAHPQPQPTLPTAALDPILLAPHATRLVFAADVARLRASASTRPWFDRLTSDERSCQARVARNIQRIVAFARDATLEDLAFVFDGGVSRDELAQCLRSGSQTLVTARYHGVELVRIDAERAANLLPVADTTEVASLTGGLVIAGPSSAVRAMVDRAQRPPASAADAMAPALVALTNRLRSGYHVALVSLVTPRVGQWASVLAHVEGVGVSAIASDALRVEALLACDDFDSPRLVADGLARARDDVASQLALAPLQALLGRASIERRAADVRVAIELSADDLSLLVLAARTFAERQSEPSAETIGQAPDAGAALDGARVGIFAH